MANNFVRNDPSASNWEWSYNVDASGTKEATLATENTFIDKDIKFKVVTPAGDYSASAAVTTTGVVTPSVAINNASTYGFTTTKPSGTNGTNYLTIDPGASITTNGKVTPTATITTSGFLIADANSHKNGSAITVNPTIADSTNLNYYVPIVTPTFSGGQLTGSTSTSITTNMATTTTSDYYIDAAASGNITLSKIKYIVSAGVIAARAASADTVNVTNGATLDASSTATRVYIPAATCTVAGGALSITNNFTKDDLALTLGTGSSTNMTNITVGAQNTSTYPYYFKVNGSTPAVSGSTKASVTAVTDTHTEGYLPAQAATTAIAAQSVSPTVSVNGTSGSTYVSLKKATATVSNSVTTNSSTAGLNGASGVVSLSDNANNGISVTATATGTMAANITATTNTTGYAPASTTLGTGSISLTTTSASTTKYITKITVPKDKPFQLETTADTALDSTSTTAILNNNFRRIDIDNAGSVNITSNNSNGKAGNLYVSAYKVSGTTDNEILSASVVTNGVWVTNNAVPFASGDPVVYYGRTVLNPMSSSSDVAVLKATGSINTITTTVAPGTVSVAKVATDGSAAGVNITGVIGPVSTSEPTSGYYAAFQGTAAANSTGVSGTITGTANAGVNTAGYASTSLTASTALSGTATAKTSAKTGDPYYFPIDAASLTFTGGALSHTFNSNITIATTDEYSNGLSMVAGRAAVTYTNTAGYIPAHASATTASAAPTNSTKYLKGVTLTAPSSGTRQFDITVPNGTTETITFHFHVDSASNVYID